MTAIEVFKHFIPLFQKEGYQLYMVGGAARDFVLKRPFSDLDLATDAPPEQLKKMFPEANHRFIQYGNIHFVIDEISVDITTLRVESHYLDARHPEKITFVQSIEEDASRRDITINALYVDAHFVVHDFFHGLDDLHAGVIKMIGEPNIRLSEDPLRIIRILRFSLSLGFVIEPSLEKAIFVYKNALSKLTQAKVKQEIDKMRSLDLVKSEQLLQKYQISL